MQAQPYEGLTCTRGDGAKGPGSPSDLNTSLIASKFNTGMSHAPLLTASVITPGELQVVQIYFDTSTFDEIERDVKVTIEQNIFMQLVCIEIIC